MNTNTRMRLDVSPVFIFRGGFSRIINSDFIFRHIHEHRENTSMMKIVELSLAKVKKVDDFRDFRTRVGRI